MQLHLIMSPSPRVGRLKLNCNNWWIIFQVWLVRMEVLLSSEASTARAIHLLSAGFIILLKHIVIMLLAV
jgi:hypothetical protein